MAARLAKTFLVGVLALAMSPPAATADDSVIVDNFGGGAFRTSEPCPLKDFPILESITPIPPFIDPFEQDSIRVFCQLFVLKNGQPVNNARGKFIAQLYLLDNTSGQFEIFELDSGKFKTNSAGFAGIAAFDFEIPTPIFADGFESGDVLAWSFTRTEFTKKKKSDQAQMSCRIRALKD